MAGGTGTVREILLHLVGGQQTFALRTKGRQHEGELHSRSPWPGFDELIGIASRSSNELIAIAEALETDAPVNLPWQRRSNFFPISFFLAHAMAHGVEHRTEIKLTLAQIGMPNPDLDGWQYATAQGYGGEVEA